MNDTSQHPYIDYVTGGENMRLISVKLEEHGVVELRLYRNTGVRSETLPKNVTGYKISNSLWTGLGILSPVTFLEAWLGVSERTPAVRPQLL